LRIVERLKLMRTSGLTLVLFVIAMLASSPSPARELVVSESEDWAWTGWGYWKAQTMGMHFRDMSLDLLGTKYPPTNTSAMHAQKIRLATDLYYQDFRLSAEYEFTFDMVTAGLDGDASLGAFGSTQNDRPRLWDPEAIDADGFKLHNNIDRLFIYLPLGPVDVKIGRQAISWGSAWFWKPTDRFSPFSPMDIDPDVKRGVDAVRAEIFLGQTTSLDLVASFERHPNTNQELWVNGGMRFRTTVGRYDLAVSAARYQYTKDSDYMLGLEFTGELGKVGFRGEAAFNYLPDSKDWDIEAVVGADYHFSMGLTLAGEFFYNGYGTDDSNNYLTFLFPADTAKAERYSRGETFHMGRYYTGISLSQEINPLLHLTLSTITNLTDPSAFAIAGLGWSVVENGRISAGALIPVGKKPAMNGLIPSLKSEFGMAPAMGYAVMKVAF
jgi:hypothetical protein